jgi:Sulfotransferase family
MTATVPIAITGMHRSGTSMITRALHESGLHLVGTSADELIDAAEDNPEGFWENKAIRECNDELLEACGGAWDNPPALFPVAVDDPRVANVAEASTAALAALREHEHWGFKDPRTCLTAAYWLDLQPDLRFVICVRHPVEVALSLKRRNQNSYSLGLALWERYYTAVLDQVPPERRIVTHYDTFFIDPAGEMARLCGFAGLEPAEPRVRGDLRHHTTTVDLGDAGVSERLRSLYAALCREAGASPLPEAPRDEGRVRRLILDGAVAQRHAEQRQAAIDRLQEREQEFRAAYAAAETELRQRLRGLEIAHRDKVRELEARVAAAGLDALESETARSLADMRESVARIERRTSATRPPSVPATLGRATRAPTPALRLLPAARQSVHRAGRLARRTATAPAATARAVKRRALQEGRTLATHLPAPAQHAARQGLAAYRQAAVAPVPAAKAAVRRLPDPAERLARRAWVASESIRDAVARHAPNTGPKAAPPPKGIAPRLWKHAYDDMVRVAWTGNDPWLVTAPGSPARTRNARSPRATRFPDIDGGRPLADDLSHIAHLEALRYAGHRHLVVPEGSRPWFRQQTELRDTIVRTYRTLTDEPNAGAVFDLCQPADGRGRSLRAAIEELIADGGPPPAVLDCTPLSLEAELRDLAVFTPPPGGRLPYLDDSVDIVVVEDGCDGDEAARVARRAVITVCEGSTGASVLSVDVDGAGAVPAGGRVLVWSDLAGDPRWEPALAERAEQAGARVVVAAFHAGLPDLAGLADNDVVLAIESHVLPLPGAIRAAAAAAANPSSAVAGKVLRSDGRLESAGGTVFFDRSIALIADSSAHVRAPWHEYVRPVCWAPGLVAATAALWARVPGPAAQVGRAYLREWCAAAWAGGSSVVYHPDVAAVRVSGDGSEPATPLVSSAWQRVLDLRPARPPELSDGVWRYLLAHDDVEACRG